MDLDIYQERAMTTCMESSKNPMYMLLMLGEEVGELQGKFSKNIRKGNIKINENRLENLTENEEFVIEFEDLVKKEIGDIMWGCAGLCSAMGWKLNEIGQMNLDKLQARKAIGTIDGNGDGIERSK